MGNKEDVLDALENGEEVATEKPDLQKEDEGIDIAEGKEFRAELVCVEDILKIIEMEKDELKKYAHSRLGRKLDLNKRIKMLRLEVVTLVKNKLKLPQDTDNSNAGPKAKPETEVAEFVFSPTNRRVFEATELLLKRTDLIPCWLVDEKGKKL